MSDDIWVKLTTEERWALDTVAVFTLERREMPEHIELGVMPHLGSAIGKLRAAQDKGPDEMRRKEGGAPWL